MSACIVCGRETACAACGGSGAQRVPDRTWREVVDMVDGVLVTRDAFLKGYERACECAARGGLTHTHPRKERKRARQWSDAAHVQGLENGPVDVVGLRIARANALRSLGARLAYLRDRTMRDALDLQEGVQ